MLYSSFGANMISSVQTMAKLVLTRMSHAARQSKGIHMPFIAFCDWTPTNSVAPRMRRLRLILPNSKHAYIHAYVHMIHVYIYLIPLPIPLYLHTFNANMRHADSPMRSMGYLEGGRSSLRSAVLRPAVWLRQLWQVYQQIQVGAVSRWGDLMYNYNSYL